MTDKTCPHESVAWWAADNERHALNEQGWQCADCQTWLGFRPDLDRSHTGVKVWGILNDFHASNLYYVSNGSMGENITDHVAARCAIEDRYDQGSILEFILQYGDRYDEPGAFWQGEAARWLCQHSPT